MFTNFRTKGPVVRQGSENEGLGNIKCLAWDHNFMSKVNGK